MIRNSKTWKVNKGNKDDKIDRDDRYDMDGKEDKDLIGIGTVRTGASFYFHNLIFLIYFRVIITIFFLSSNLLYSIISYPFH